MTSQAFWLDHFLAGARQRKFEFYVPVYRNDYDPIGLWAARQGILPENLYNVNNIFPAWAFTMITVRSKTPSPTSGRMHCLRE
jgi:hypothetical protein